MKPTGIEELMEMWEKDAKVDQTDPSNAIIHIPVLHAKYVREHALHTLAAKQCGVELSRMKKIKWEYYNGKLDEATLKKYGLEPFRFVIKSDISIYFDADEDLIKIQARKLLHDQAIEVCTAIMKELNSRTFQIKAFMEWERFVAGQH